MKFHTIFLLLLLPTLLFGRSKNDINIAGHVVDKATGEHIPFATLYIEENASGVNSDASGHYILTNVPEGKINVRASFVGYKTTSQSITTRKEQTYVLNFELEEEPLTMEEVVVTGNRYATRKRETNTIVGVLPPKLFECVAATNPAQILDFQPGLRVVYDCGNCGVPQLRINGLSGQYSQLLLDSRAIFSSLGMVYGLEQLPTSMIERVEVIRGGGSALYGSNAIGGTVNIITKEPTSSLFQVSNQTGVIGNSATDINTTINGAIVSSDLRSGAYLFGSMRQRESYDHNGDNFTDLPELKDQTLGFRAYHKIRDHSKITLEYHHIHENRRGGDSLNLPPHQANIAEMLEHNINGGSISYDYSPRGSKNSFNLYTSGQLIDRNSYFGTHQNLNAYGKTKDITANFGAQWIHRFDQLWFLPSTLTAGVDYAYNKLRDEMLGYNRTLDQTTHLTGTYLQNEWSNKTVGILIGGRLDYHNQIKKPIFSPRLSLRYAPTQSITLRTSYAQGYRAPQIYDEDLHVAAVGGEVALIEVAPNLREERSHTINLSADYWKTIGHWKLNLLAEGFYTDLNDVFSLVEKGHDQQGNLLLERTNASGAFVTGVNMEARLIHGNNWNLQGGFTYQKSRYKEDFSWSKEPTVQAQRRMFRSPDTYGYMTIEYLPIKPLSISLNGTYTGSMLIQHYAGSIPVDREETSPSFFDLGARIAYDFSLSSQNKLQLFVAAKNLFNQFQKDLDWGADKDSKYFYGPAAPRSFYAGVKYSF